MLFEVGSLLIDERLGIACGIVFAIDSAKTWVLVSVTSGYYVKDFKSVDLNSDVRKGLIDCFD